MKKRGYSFTIIFSSVFMFVGLCLTAAGIIVLVRDIRFKETAVEVEAEITEISSYRSTDGDRNYNIYVSYSYDGRTYEDVKLGFYNSSMYEGERISILCDPKNPRHISTAGGMIFLVVLFCCLGMLFVVIGAVPAIMAGKKAIRRKKVISTGRKLFATVEEINWNTSYRVNGRHPYQIYCSYRDDYQDIIYRFKSDNLWTDPSMVLRTGDIIPVYVDEKNYSHYYVDAESVLNGKIVDYT